MKIITNAFKMVLTTAFIVPLFLACEKEEQPEPIDVTPITSELELKINPKINRMTFPQKNGLLVFKDIQELKETVTFLEKEVIAYDDAFLAMYGHLGPEALEEIEEEINFDQYTPLKVFAANNKLNSLFLQQVEAEEAWLSQPELDLTTDPDNHFVEDKALQAVLNDKSEVIIGKAIYKITDYGHLIIRDGDFETLAHIRKNPSRVAYKNVAIIGSNAAAKAAGCKSSKGTSGFKTSGDYRIKWKISHRTPITGRRIKCTTVNYKKKKKNKWKQVRYYTLVKPYGTISGSKGKCDKAVDFNPTNLYSDRYNKKSWSWKVNVQTKTKSGWVKGYHKGAGGISHTSVLSW